ncbi:MAG: GuaB3 family IMP dehydrogenase-related protein [Dehalococcoidia bacterium]|nr:GuaB3 family IMP dehydrogenase-related protein [Dehalococcoidia bacterium]
MVAGEPTLSESQSTPSNYPVPKTLDRAYGFDDVAIVPGAVTTNPDMVTPEFTLGQYTFSTPIIAAAMDGVTSPDFAVQISKKGGFAVLNLDGLWTRYTDADGVLEEIAAADVQTSTSLIQKAYGEPVKENLIGQRIEEINSAGGISAVSVAPQNAKRFAPLTRDAGVNVLTVASTVTTAKHISRSLEGLQLDKLVEVMADIPVLVGNTVDKQATLELMRTGIHGVLVGVGPGAACTSREVLGVGMPQVSATLETAHARDIHFADSGHYVPIITDGGLRTGGDVSKAICAGADAVMIGSPFASCVGAPGRGYHWGMATPNADLPRGVRVQVHQNTTLDKLLFGPTSKTDGTENLVGALKTSMGTCGAQTIKDFHSTRMIIAPSIKTEGKIYQISQTRPAGI